MDSNGVEEVGFVFRMEIFSQRENPPLSQNRGEVGHPARYMDYFGAAAFLGNISPMRLICAPTSFSFSSIRS